MNKKQLEQYYGIASNIEAIEQEIYSLYTPVSSPTGRPSAGNTALPSSPTEQAVMRIIHLKELVSAEHERMCRLLEEIEEWLTTVEDPEVASIIRWHYLMRLNWSRTNMKVYGYPDYDYSRKKVDRYFEKHQRLSELSE